MRTTSPAVIEKVRKQDYEDSAKTGEVYLETSQVLPTSFQSRLTSCYRCDIDNKGMKGWHDRNAVNIRNK
jgi:hypothetical protein